MSGGGPVASDFGPHPESGGQTDRSAPWPTAAELNCHENQSLPVPDTVTDRSQQDMVGESAPLLLGLRCLRYLLFQSGLGTEGNEGNEGWKFRSEAQVEASLVPPKSMPFMSVEL